jgi:hypothetical protein
MKNILTFQLLFFSLAAFAQDNALTISGDTLMIRQTNITEDPFRFGDNPLKYLLKMRHDKPTAIKKSVVENSHVENKMDTSFDIRFGDDRFALYKWDVESNGLVSAHLKTNKFSTKQGIRIGMKKADIIKLLSAYNLTLIPRVLILEDLETAQNLTFEFRKEVLVSIEFSGYLD